MHTSAHKHTHPFTILHGGGLLAEGALHEVPDGAVGVALLEEHGHEEVGHGLGHVDLDASQQEQRGLADRARLVEVDDLVHEFLFGTWMRFEKAEWRYVRDRIRDERNIAKLRGNMTYHVPWRC